MPTIDALAKRLDDYLEPTQVQAVRRAYYYAEQAHDGQMRKSGEAYVTHPLVVASILVWREGRGSEAHAWRILERSAFRASAWAPAIDARTAPAQGSNLDLQQSEYILHRLFQQADLREGAHAAGNCWRARGNRRSSGHSGHVRPCPRDLHLGLRVINLRL